MAQKEMKKEYDLSFRNTLLAENVQARWAEVVVDSHPERKYIFLYFSYISYNLSDLPQPVIQRRKIYLVIILIYFIWSASHPEEKYILLYFPYISYNLPVIQIENISYHISHIFHIICLSSSKKTYLIIFLIYFI